MNTGTTTYSVKQFSNNGGPRCCLTTTNLKEAVDYTEDAERVYGGAWKIYWFHYHKEEGKYTQCVYSYLPNANDRTPFMVDISMS